MTIAITGDDCCLLVSLVQRHLPPSLLWINRKQLSPTRAPCGCQVRRTWAVAKGLTFPPWYNEVCPPSGNSGIFTASDSENQGGLAVEHGSGSLV